MSITANFPTIRPTLNLDFVNSRTVDPRITFTRASTATYFDRLGVLRTAAVNEPRIDFDPATGACRGLLIEEQRTNLLVRSQEFDNASWSKANVTVTANAIVAPDGTLTAYKLVENTSRGQHLLQQIYSVVNGTTYTYSVYVKAAEWTSFTLQIGGGGQIGTFNLSAVTATFSNGATAAAIVPAGNGWYRCSVTGPANASTAMYMYKTGSEYTGDGTSGIYIWGAQLEEGAFHTSYIPTVASQVTRSADNAVMTGTNFSSWYRQDEGTLFAEASSFSGAGVSSNMLTVSDGGNANRTQVYYSITPRAAVEIRAAGAVVGAILSSATSYTVGSYTKVALGQRSGDTSFAANGSVVASQSNSFAQANISQMDIGKRQDAASWLNGHIRRIAYYPARLPNAQLQALTA